MIWGKSILIILLACFYIPLFSQTDTLHTEIESDTIQESITSITLPQAVDFRVPDQSKIEEYKKDSRFDYKHVEKKATWWDRVKQWFWSKVGKVFVNVADSGILSVIIIIAIIILICFIVLKFLGIDYRTLLGKKKLDTPEIDIYTENVHEMDFDTLIANAMKNGDYRLAVRFLYLKNLKLLSDKEFIDWKVNKTNYSYQHEINNSAIRSKFLENTLIFDYVWYGEFIIDQSQFSDIYNRMSNFSKMITNG